MRLALLSDIHGNPIALEAVLADVAGQGGADAYWLLDDVGGDRRRGAGAAPGVRYIVRIVERQVRSP